jgi:hypothetical protein
LRSYLWMCLKGTFPTNNKQFGIQAVMPSCAFLTMNNPAGFVIDDELAYEPLLDAGWTVEALPWDSRTASWDRYDIVIIRSTWDYHHTPEQFLETLERIEATGTRLENPLSLVRWNYRKTYLKDLVRKSVPIVPTVWHDRLTNGTLDSLFDQLASDDIVVKPVVSASADGTYRLQRHTVSHCVDEVTHCFARRALMAQPLVRSVLDEGEYSLFYFNGKLSHVILKTPRAGDFRVQEEHGGYIRPVHAEPALIAAGGAAMHALDTVPLYARVDFVRANDGNAWWLMEFELIEPALYFRMSPDAPRLFAEAVNERMRHPSTNRQNQ